MIRQGVFWFLLGMAFLVGVSSCRKPSEDICQSLAIDSEPRESLFGTWKVQSFMVSRTGNSFKRIVPIDRGRLNITNRAVSFSRDNTFSLDLVVGANHELTFDIYRSTYIGTDGNEDGVIATALDRAICFSIMDDELFIHFTEFSESKDLRKVFREILNPIEYQKYMNKNVIKFVREG